MSTTIGVFTGSASSFNVLLDASHAGQALSEAYTTHLLSTDGGFVSDVEAHFDGAYGLNESSSIAGEIAALRSYVHSETPDILIQLTNPPVHGMIVGTVAKANGIKFIYRYSGDRFNVHKLSSLSNKIPHFLLNNIVGRPPLYLADGYITMGPYGASVLQKHGVSDDDIEIIPPAIDRIRFETGRLYGQKPAAIPDSGAVAISVGRVSRRKGKKVLERTIPRIVDSRDDLHFVLVGPIQDPVCVSDEYTTHVTHVGGVPPEAIPRYLSFSDVLVHPSLIEGLPRVILESLASGTPVIAREVGDIGFATENTFTTDDEFVEMVSSFEDQRLDDVEDFCVESLHVRYQNVVRQLK
ncbi:glycosyltransferase family 4 protein [Halococcus salsus]|uniref:glycosyltransferase family 4 protein n=1 Tax=Halococcus salsus TaxID=2162894 RepID=UPI0013576670|nr:glycosyltransferase family 4 protein [Halococcus salsus]